MASYPVHDRVQPNYQLGGTNIQATVQLLRNLLAIEYVLLVKTQNYHWNVTGMSFGSIHKMLDKQYKQLSKFVDRLAEQIRKYGTASPGSLLEFLQLNQGPFAIQEIPGQLIAEELLLDDLARSNEQLIAYINTAPRERLDLATENLFAEILDFHMKNVWMLRSHY